MNAQIRRVAGFRRTAVWLAAGMALAVALAPSAPACHTKSYPLRGLALAGWGQTLYTPPAWAPPVPPQVPTASALPKAELTTTPIVVTPTVPVTPTAPVAPALPPVTTPGAPPITPVPEPPTGLIALSLIGAAVWIRQCRRWR